MKAYGGYLMLRHAWRLSGAKLLVPFLFLLITLPTKAQRIATLVLQDARGWRDTVYFGQENGATPGIDPALGEVEISSIPMLGTEMRFVSRAPRSCFLDSMLTYRRHSYETKKDVRGQLNGSGAGRLGSINYGYTTSEMEENMFHLKIKCTSQPCTLTAVTSGPFIAVHSFFTFYPIANSTWESSCRSLFANASGIFIPNDFPGMLLEIDYPSFVRDTTFYLAMYYYFGSGNISIPKSLRALNLKVEHHTLIAGEGVLAPAAITIVDAVGREQYRQSWPQGESHLPLPPLHGLYLVRLRYPDDRVVVVRHLFGD